MFHFITLPVAAVFCCFRCLLIFIDAAFAAYDTLCRHAATDFAIISLAFAIDAAGLIIFSAAASPLSLMPLFIIAACLSIFYQMPLSSPLILSSLFPPAADIVRLSPPGFRRHFFLRCCRLPFEYRLSPLIEADATLSDAMLSLILLPLSLFRQSAADTLGAGRLLLLITCWLSGFFR